MIRTTVKQSNVLRRQVSRTFATGTRGARGHGWFHHYRGGRGGRHLQGEYFDRDSLEHCQAWNQSILDLGSQRVFMDILAEPRRNLNSGGSSATGSVSSTNQRATPSFSNNPKKFFPIPPLDTLTGETYRIVIDVASMVLPATCENFINLIQPKNETTGSAGERDNPIQGYRGTRLYRIEKNVGIYGGDVLTNTGRTGRAYQALGLTRDVSETDPIPMWHIPGTITMIVPSVNEIDSRFLICTQHAPHIDGICRPFGMVSPETLPILQKWQTSLLTLYGGVPNAFDLYVVNCGVLVPDDQHANDPHAVTNKATSATAQQGQQMQQ